MNVSLMDETSKYYAKLFSDIGNAKKIIYMEVYRISPCEYAEKLRNILIEKVLAGVDVRLLLDAWGAGYVINYFDDVVKLGGQVRFFDRVKISLNGVSKWHRRNHRKIIVIDDNISYIGSSNITGYNLGWRELMIRIEDIRFATEFKYIFLQQFDEEYNLFYNKLEQLDPVFVYDKYIILRDRPSVRKQIIRKAIVKLLKKAKKRVIIESPYFLPSFLIRKELIRAARRGVKVDIITSKHSDVNLVDILRSKYFGPLYEEGIAIHLYKPDNIHAKLFIVDNNYMVGSSNFDYRSFMFQHEIALLGSSDQLLGLLEQHIDQTLFSCEDFNYNSWKRRSKMERILEFALVPIRHLL